MIIREDVKILALWKPKMGNMLLLTLAGIIRSHGYQIAVSKDLFHWQKKGPAFAKAYNGKFLDMPTKSGSIITKMKNNRPVVAKINGKYWMYWGENFVNLAWSENLSDWNPLVDENGDLRKAISPRPGNVRQPPY